MNSSAGPVRALVEGVPDERDLERLRKGVPVDGERTDPAKVQLKRVVTGKKGAQSVLEIVIHEGRNRQIRKMADAIAHPVARLKRVRIGHVTDAGLHPGDFRDLTPGEIRDLMKATPWANRRRGVSRAAVVRSSGGRGRRSVRTGARVLKAAAIIVRGVRLVAIAPGGLPVAATATGDPPGGGDRSRRPLGRRSR